MPPNALLISLLGQSQCTGDADSAWSDMRAEHGTDFADAYDNVAETLFQLFLQGGKKITLANTEGKDLLDSGGNGCDEFIDCHIHADRLSGDLELVVLKAKDWLDLEDSRQRSLDQRYPPSSLQILHGLRNKGNIIARAVSQNPLDDLLAGKPGFRPFHDVLDHKLQRLTGRSTVDDRNLAGKSFSGHAGAVDGSAQC